MNKPGRKSLSTNFVLLIWVMLLFWCAASGPSGLLWALVLMAVSLTYCLYRVLNLTRTTSDRLIQLDELRQRGLITETEFQLKRAELLGEL